MPSFTASQLALLAGSITASGVAIFAHLVGYDRDRSFYPVVLTVVGSLYILFAAMADAGSRIITEVAFFALFVVLAAIGFRRSLWIAALGLALHGAFDFIRDSYAHAPGAPEWWPAFCGAYDLVAAFGLVAIIMRRTAGDENRMRM